MTDFFSHFHFLRPEWLGLLPGLLLLEWMLRKQQHSGDNFEKIIDPALLAALRVQGTKGRWFTPNHGIGSLIFARDLNFGGPNLAPTTLTTGRKHDTVGDGYRCVRVHG